MKFCAYWTLFDITFECSNCSGHFYIIHNQQMMKILTALDLVISKNGGKFHSWCTLHSRPMSVLTLALCNDVIHTNFIDR